MPHEFYAACEGYLERQKESAMVIRFASFRVAEAMAGSKAIGEINKFWPMEEDDEKREVEPMTADRYKAILERHNLKIK
ncbi:hypothetical protein UFOVP462_14 [uncultured Caudovirales phage]|uniref:Uncharacterized protein n=1 Tax=uncultured Caudovirales phage TaxID=2100421 RepID=A0A6J5MGA3_9CAUD|nr:hypothetical protein UFOVP462_14 [uncultured Caudovirales phage]